MLNVHIARAFIGLMRKSWLLLQCHPHLACAAIMARSLFLPCNIPLQNWHHYLLAVMCNQRISRRIFGVITELLPLPLLVSRRTIVSIVEMVLLYFASRVSLHIGLAVFSLNLGTLLSMPKYTYMILTLLLLIGWQTILDLVCALTLWRSWKAFCGKTTNILHCISMPMRFLPSSLTHLM